MSLSLALGTSFNGLKANQLQFALLSKNVENAAVPHYVRKDAVLTTRVVAGISLGLEVGISRDVDERLVRDVRLQTASNSSLATKAEYLKMWAAKVGQPQDEYSVSTVLNEFKIALQTLEGNSGSQVDQLNAVRAAESLASKLNGLHREANALRADADAQIRQKVEVVNKNLDQIAKLNKSIAGGSVSDLGDLLDERDRLVDEISQELGVTTYLRENGEMVILAKGGASLLDSSVNHLEFSPFGDLRTADGTVLTPAPGNASAVRGGAIAGLFDIRDNVMPEFMSQLDGMAAGIITMFEGADASLAPGQAGLFTDGGAAYDPANVVGLAERIRVNDSVRPSAGGDLWKISSGLGAAAPAPGADSTQVTAFLDAFASDLAFGSSGSLPGSATIEEFAVAMVSSQQTARVTAESELRVSDITLSTLRESRMNRDGVNVDDELMKIALVEHSYQASTAVITSIQEMLDTLLAAT